MLVSGYWRSAPLEIVLKLIGVASIVGAVGLVATAVATLTARSDRFALVESTEVAAALGMSAQQLDSQLTNLSFRTRVMTVSTIHWDCTGPGAGFKRNAIRSTTYAENTERQWVTRGRGALTGFNVLGPKGNPKLDSEVDGPNIGGKQPTQRTHNLLAEAISGSFDRRERLATNSFGSIGDHKIFSP